MPDHIYTIYLITCLPNSKYYTGFTSIKIKSRWAKHKFSAKKSCKYILHKAIRKYDWENFIIEEIYQSLDGEHCKNVMEEYFIRKFKSHVSEGGYNMTYGGEGIIGYKHTQEAKERMKITNKGKSSIEGNRKISESNKGKQASEETKEKLRKANLGRKQSKEAIKNFSLARQRSYLIIFPDGHQEQIKGLGEFSKQYNLSLSGLKRSSRCGSYYKGYLVKRL